jgi:diadenosine tetraphosphatase ApaH/serine/threonine PP2A family protein phosphatase/uncharacterized membrane protein YqaE (UPF0057 family)
MRAFSLSLRQAGFWAGCFALVLAIRLCHAGVLWADEAYGIAAARRILEGASLYRGFWFDKPPLYAWIYLLWGAQTGWLLRLGGAVFALACCWLAHRAASALFTPREGYCAAAAMAFFLSFDHPAAIVSLAPDLLLIPFALASIWFCASGRTTWAGVLAAAGLLANAKALFLLPVVVFWSPGAWRRIVLAYSCTVPLVWALARGWWEPVWLWGFQYSRDTFVADPLVEGLRRTANWTGFHAALALAAAVFFLESKDLRWRIGLWLLLSLAAVFAGARFFPRYYLVLLPPLAVAAARGLCLLGRRRIAALLLLPLFVPAIRFGGRHLATLGGQPAAMRDLILYEDARQAAAEIRCLARPGDTLLVWGYRPELNVLAGLPGGAPFLDSQPLTGVLADRHLHEHRPSLPEIAARNRQRLIRTNPAFIADGLGGLNSRLAITRYPDLRPWLSKYRLAAATAGTLIYRLADD